MVDEKGHVPINLQSQMNRGEPSLVAIFYSPKPTLRWKIRKKRTRFFGGVTVWIESSITRLFSWAICVAKFNDLIFGIFSTVVVCSRCSTEVYKDERDN